MLLTLKITCPWCRTQYADQISTNCRNCGGPLPQQDRSTRGPTPPQPPRVLPEKFKKQVMLWKNTCAFIGLIFMIIGVPLIPLFGFGLIFFIVGYFLFKAGRKTGRQKLLALEKGSSYEGAILEITKDFTENMNGRNPYIVSYQFAVNDQQQIGKTKSWDDNILLKQPGDPVWVVYSSDEGGVSSLWPPLV